jgi:hypothetical protein
LVDVKDNTHALIVTTATWTNFKWAHDISVSGKGYGRVKNAVMVYCNTITCRTWNF